MARRYILEAGEVQEMGRRKDAANLQARGFEMYTPGAVPQYVAWIREDVCLTASLLGFIAEEIRWIRRCSMAVVVLLALHLIWRF